MKSKSLEWNMRYFTFYNSANLNIETQYVLYVWSEKEIIQTNKKKTVYILILCLILLQMQFTCSRCNDWCNNVGNVIF